LTGFFADDDLLESLVNDVKHGETLADSFRGLADVVMQLLEQEDEYQRSDEAVNEALTNDGEAFTEDGRRF
jgi:Fe-S-cluster formation regulator IscX/YfhJ